jgi:hypothetical protein
MEHGGLLFACNALAMREGASVRMHLSSNFAESTQELAQCTTVAWMQSRTGHQTDRKRQCNSIRG